MLMNQHWENTVFRRVTASSFTTWNNNYYILSRRVMKQLLPERLNCETQKSMLCLFFFLQGFPMYRKSKHWQRFKLFQDCAKKWKQFSKALHKKKKNCQQSGLGAMPPWVKGWHLRTRQYLIRTCHQKQSCLRSTGPSIWEWQWTGQLRTSDRSDSVWVSAADVHQTSSQLTGKLWGNVLKPAYL